MSNRIALMAVLILSACSSTPSGGGNQTAKTAQATDAQKGVVCTYERPVGSIMKEKRCTSRQQRDEARQQNEGLMDVRDGTVTGTP